MPMSCVQYEPLAARIVVEIVALLTVKMLRRNRLRVTRRLPKPMLSVIACSAFECLHEGWRHHLVAELDKPSACEFPELDQAIVQLCSLKLGVKHNHVQMRWHNDVRIQL